MRRVLTIAAALTFFATAGSAFAQSGQGGYLGLNPGKNVATTTTRPAPSQGSGQGGYLGKNPGAGLSAAQAAPIRGSGQGGYLGRNPGGNPDQRAMRAPGNPA
jgi:hypothetical protein